MNKTLYVISTPIGNLSDFSQRAIDTLKACDIILCEDTRVSIKLLNHFNIKKPLLKYEKFSEHKVANDAEILFTKYSTVGLISDAGSPCISDPGSVFVNKVRSLDYDIFAIPGCSAVIYAMSVSGFSNDNFSFLGFLPRLATEQKKLFNSLNINSENLNCFVFYESPNRLLSTLKNLQSSDLEIEKTCVINDATKLHEKHYYGKIYEVIGSIAENDKSSKGEYVIVFQIKQKKVVSTELSLESLLINEMITNHISSKEAIKKLSNTYSRNDLYKAYLNLKNII